MTLHKHNLNYVNALTLCQCNFLHILAVNEDWQKQMGPMDRPELIGKVRRCLRLYIEKQQNKEAGYFTNGVTMFYL